MPIQVRGAGTERLKELLGRHHRAHQPVVDRRVVTRRPDGFLEVQAVDRVCTEPVDGNAGTGDRLALPAAAGPAGAPGISETVTEPGGLVHIETYDPSELPRGRVHRVEITGDGLTEDLRIEHLTGGGAEASPHPGVSLRSLTVHSPESATLEVDVAADAELVTEAPIRYGVAEPPEPLTRRRADTYTVVPSYTYRWVAWWHVDGRLQGITIEDSGLYSRPVGDPVSAPDWTVETSVALARPGLLQGLGDDAVMWTAEGRLSVADARTGVVHEWGPDQGQAVGAAAVAPWGLVAWVWRTPGNQGPTTTVELVSLGTDPADPDPLVLQSVDLVSPFPGSVPTWHPVLSTGFTRQAAYIEIGFNPPGGSAAAVAPYVGFADRFGGLGAATGTGAPDGLGGSVAHGLRWNGDTGGEGFPGWGSWAHFTWALQDGVGGLSSDGTRATLYDPSTGHLIEANPGFSSSSVNAELTLQPHPTLGLPDWVVPGV